MWNFLKSNSPESTMRVNVFLVTLAGVLILLAIVFHIVAMTIAIYNLAKNPQMDYTKVTTLIQWGQLTATLGGIAALLSSTYYMKVQQKKLEGEVVPPATPEATTTTTTEIINIPNEIPQN